MARRSYRRRRRHSPPVHYVKWIILILVLIIVIPLILVKGVKLPWIRSHEIPLVNVWNEKTQELLSMTLEEYVQGVVAAEMPVSFELEALKAQAVVARTYAYQRIVNNERIAEHPEAHLSTDYRSGQAWVSAEELRDRWNMVDYYRNIRKIAEAVDSTCGEVATYNGDPILAVYHSTSGGRTENSEHYWTAQLPYLRSVTDPYGDHSPYQYTKASVSLADFLRLMEIKQLGQVKVVERYPSGRVKTMEAGSKWFSGRDVRQRLGLRSSWFTVDVGDTQVEFAVWGYGHGVGMSQYGADGMAKSGYDYGEILSYYYQGITLHRLYK